MKIITISREYGAYGHTIGRLVAQKLGIEVYDKDIVRSAARNTGLSEDDIRSREELLHKSDSFLRSISPSFSYSQIDEIFAREKDAILSFAAKGPCVIVGRCADAILREAGYDALNVFLHASEKIRYDRVGELIGSTNPADIHKAIRVNDNARESYYRYFTEQKWGDYTSYDLMLDAGTLGIEKCVALICAAAE